MNQISFKDMTSKEALKQLQVYCAANGFALYPSSLPKQTYSIILADGDNGEITTRYRNRMAKYLGSSPYWPINTGYQYTEGNNAPTPRKV